MMEWLATMVLGLALSVSVAFDLWVRWTVAKSAQRIAAKLEEMWP